jgi:glycosyltransferase involved in cell wall biosynthesis
MLESLQTRISVIIPVLNGASSLAETIQSILSQDYPYIELIVIDGGSSDGTLDIIHGFSSEIAYWETGQDSGISNAFNRGISHATGELVAILNSDDTWESDALKQVLDAIAASPDADIYYGQVRYFDPVTSNSYIRRPDLSRMKERMYLFHPAIFARKTAYEQIGWYSDEYKLAMDSEWLHRAIAGGLKFKAIDSVLANMSLGGRSDQQFVAALNEYRRSLLEHRITGLWSANLYFIKYACLKTMMQASWLRQFKQKFLK